MSPLDRTTLVRTRSQQLRGEDLDFDPVRESWKQLPDSRIDGYAATVPVEWAQAAAEVASAIALIKSARDRIDACLVEIQRVLA